MPDISTETIIQRALAYLRGIDPRSMTRHELKRRVASAALGAARHDFDVVQSVEFGDVRRDILKKIIGGERALATLSSNGPGSTGKSSPDAQPGNVGSGWL